MTAMMSKAEDATQAEEPKAACQTGFRVALRTGQWCRSLLRSSFRPSFGSSFGAATLLCGLLAGCTGSLLESDMPVNSIYVLRSAHAMEGGDSALPDSRVEGEQDFPAAALVDLSIGRPHLAPGLDTDRIAVIRGRQLDYYRAARWGARAAEVVQSLLVDTLQDQRVFNSVTAEQTRVGAAYLLDIDVRDFQAEYGAEYESEYAGTGAPAVQVHFTGRLIRVADRSLVATFETQSRQQVSQNRLSQVVAAFESAAREAALALTRQTALAIDRDAGALRPAGVSQ